MPRTDRNTKDDRTIIPASNLNGRERCSINDSGPWQKRDVTQKRPSAILERFHARRKGKGRRGGHVNGLQAPPCATRGCSTRRGSSDDGEGGEWGDWRGSVGPRANSSHGDGVRAVKGDVVCLPAGSTLHVLDSQRLPIIEMRTSEAENVRISSGTRRVSCDVHTPLGLRDQSRDQFDLGAQRSCTTISVLRGCCYDRSTTMSAFSVTRERAEPQATDGIIAWQ